MAIVDSVFASVHAKIAQQRAALDHLEQAIEGYVQAFGPGHAVARVEVAEPSRRVARPRATKPTRRPRATPSVASPVSSATMGTPADRLLEALKDGQPRRTSDLRRALKLNSYRLAQVLGSLGSRVRLTGSTNKRQVQLAPKPTRAHDADQFETVWDGRGPLPGAEIR